MIRRFCFLILLVAFICAPAATALADDPLKLLELKISLWPEYDQPGMLVIYRGQVDQTSADLARIQLQIPASAAGTLQLAYSVNGQLLSLEHLDTVNGPLMTVAFVTPNGGFQLEYYDAALNISAPARHYSFAATVPYLIENLILEVQQPTGATDLTTDPVLGNPIPGPDGLIYETSIRSDVPANESIRVDVSYTKTNNTLSVDSPSPDASTPLDATPTPVSAATTGQTPGNNLGLGIIGIVVVLALVGGLVWFTRPKAKAAQAKKGRRAERSKKATPQKQAAVAEPVKAVYCQQCGQKARPTD